MRLTRSGIGAVLVVAGALGALASASSAPVAARPAAPDQPYAGAASADGVRLTYEVEGFLVVERLADGGGPVAQATVSALESVGFASVPDPGETVLGAPPMVRGATEAPVPDYPLVASSRYPGQEEQTVDQGVVRLSATSTSTSSTASARGGGPDDDQVTVGSTRAVAEVVHDEATGAVTSTASTKAEMFTVADVFRIGRVTSTATVADTPDGDPKRDAAFQLGEVTVAGQAVIITEEGLSLAGASTPLPEGSPLLDALADHGIEIRYLTAEETPDGVLAPGVEVRVQHPLPSSPSPGVAVYRLGRASASATGGMGTFGGGALGELTAPMTGSPSNDTGDATSDVAGPDPVSEAGSNPVDDTPTPDTSDVPDVDSDQLSTAPIAVAATPQWAKSWTIAFYLMIVLSGVVLVSSGQLIRLVAVRMPWTS